MERPGLKAGALIALLAFSGAAPVTGAAPSVVFSKADLARQASISRNMRVPHPVSFRDAKGRGLLLPVWINGTGPYTFAIDTGAGTHLIGSAVVSRARLSPVKGRQTHIGGLSNQSLTISGEQTVLNNFALGEPTNVLPSTQRGLVVTSLPYGVDGILDPTEAFAPLGYVIDMPNRRLLPFDTSTDRLRLENEPQGGTVVRWVREKEDRRPFVKLADNRLALIDTGSGFGLGLTYDAIVTGNHRSQPSVVRDLGGGVIQSRRVAPTTVAIGSLVLRKVPTDVLVGAHENAPVILGRDALYPFRITFDPASRLIEIAPVPQQ